MGRLPIIQEDSFERKRANWDDRAEAFRQSHPLKGLKTLPKMVGITKETKKFLKLKALRWIATEDHTGGVRREILKSPISYGWRYLKSILKRASFKRDGDLFLYGVSSVDAYKKGLEDPNAIFVLGFSYCQKPLECPSGRFTPECQNSDGHPVCSQCPIGRMRHLAPRKSHVVMIPTVHYIGEEVLKLANAHPDRPILFMITACEMTLEMFGDFGNMAGIKGIGVRLDGRICNTFEAFALSEKGIKPGLTVVLTSTEERMIDILRPSA